MRSESEIDTLINQIAQSDDRIRAVLLNGSRANPKVRKDNFQDFDIVFIVNNFNSFLKDHSWVDIFGKRLIMQLPDTLKISECDKNEDISFAYLMLFEDGNRIDLTLFPKEKMNAHFKQDSLIKVLLDKDGLFSVFTPSSDKDYWIKKPNEKEFLDHCNEFWWVSTYVAKGLVRKEITYAKAMMEGPVRKMFMKMLEWHIGVKYDFKISLGKDGKFVQQYVSEEMYKKILATYPDSDAGHIWNSLFIMTDLFKEFSITIKNNLDFQWNDQETKNVISYLKKVRESSKK